MIVFTTQTFVLRCETNVCVMRWDTNPWSTIGTAVGAAIPKTTKPVRKEKKIVLNKLN